MNKEERFLDSVAFVQKTLKTEFNVETKASIVRSTMKKDLKMSYRKVKPNAWTVNTV